MLCFGLWQADGIPSSFPREGTRTSGEQQESIDSSCSIINFLQLVIISL